MKKIILLLVVSVFLGKCTLNDIPIESPPVPTETTKPSTPKTHQIKTTFIPQAPEKNWDQPWQDACEEASILTVHYYYQKVNPSLEQILSDYQTIIGESESHDINLTQMGDAAQRRYGYTPKVIDNPSIDIIKSYLLNDTPVIVTANGKTLYRENKHFKSGGPWYHSLVILGYDDNKKQFTVHDVGTQFGAYFKYSYNLMMESIHDLPTSGHKEDINSGDKKVLVLLQ
jgi:hypothetical protein